MNTECLQALPEMEAVDLELVLDDRSLPEKEWEAAPASPSAQWRDLAVERQAAYRQMDRLMQDIRRLRDKTQRFERCQQSMVADMMFRMAVVAEGRKGGGPETVVRVGVMSALLAHEICCPDDFCDAIQCAAPLRDVGWSALPYSGLVTADHGAAPLALRAQHCLLGARILGDSEALPMLMAASIAEAHHERNDGSGYPRQLSGSSIPMAAHIAGCVDCFESLMTDSDGRPALSAELALKSMLTVKSAFDPEILGALERLRELILAIRHSFDASVVTEEIRLALPHQWNPGFWRRFVTG